MVFNKHITLDIVSIVSACVSVMVIKFPQNLQDSNQLVSQTFHNIICNVQTDKSRMRFLMISLFLLANCFWCKRNRTPCP